MTLCDPRGPTLPRMLKHDPKQRSVRPPLRRTRLQVQVQVQGHGGRLPLPLTSCFTPTPLRSVSNPSTPPKSGSACLSLLNTTRSARFHSSYTQSASPGRPVLDADGLVLWQLLNVSPSAAKTAVNTPKLSFGMADTVSAQRDSPWSDRATWRDRANRGGAQARPVSPAAKCPVFGKVQATADGKPVAHPHW